MQDKKPFTMAQVPHIIAFISCAIWHRCKKNVDPKNKKR